MIGESGHGTAWLAACVRRRIGQSLSQLVYRAGHDRRMPIGLLHHTAAAPQVADHSVELAKQ